MLIRLRKSLGGKSLGPVAVAAMVVLSLAASGCGKGKNKNVKIDGVEGPNVNFLDNKLMLTMVLKNVNFDGGARFQLGKLKNSYVEVGPDFQSNGLLVSVGVDAADLQTVLNTQLNLLEPTKLPGGRALPGVAAGQLPAIAVQIPKLANMTVYFGPTVLGVFVPVALPWDNYMGTFRFYDPAGDAIGNLSIVGRDEKKENSGVLALINLKGKVSTVSGLQLK